MCDYRRTHIHGRLCLSPDVTGVAQRRAGALNCDTTEGHGDMTPSWDKSFESILLSLLRGLSDDAPLNPDQDLASLGLDSMASVELLLNLEDTYEFVTRSC